MDYAQKFLDYCENKEKKLRETEQNQQKLKKRLLEGHLESICGPILTLGSIPFAFYTNNLYVIAPMVVAGTLLSVDGAVKTE